MKGSIQKMTPAFAGAVSPRRRSAVHIGRALWRRCADTGVSARPIGSRPPGSDPGESRAGARPGVGGVQARAAPA